MPCDTGLTKKEKAFVEAYLTGFNQTKAALQAGCSPKGAGVAGHRLMKKEAVASEIARRLEGKKEQEVTAARIVSELARLAFAEGGEELKPADRLRALDMLAKYISLGEEKKETADAGGVIILPQVLPCEDEEDKL
ncbi:hypothetical protein SDC9_87701 [bioreactor metagenome]|uniref:Terminase small subunit n=1 Tax=bioreactor metagenome TaxID=1076179 RepID=A0A644ZJK3_9ZZZZ